MKKIDDSTAKAIAAFLEKNSLTAENTSVSIINAYRVLIRIYKNGWTVLNNRDAEKNVYSGENHDSFVWKCFTRSSGILSLI